MHTSPLHPSPSFYLMMRSHKLLQHPLAKKELLKFAAPEVVRGMGVVPALDRSENGRNPVMPRPVLFLLFLTTSTAARSPKNECHWTNHQILVSAARAASVSVGVTDSAWVCRLSLFPFARSGLIGRPPRRRSLFRPATALFQVLRGWGDSVRVWGKVFRHDCLAPWSSGVRLSFCARGPRDRGRFFWFPPPARPWMG